MPSIDSCAAGKVPLSALDNFGRKLGSWASAGYASHWHAEAAAAVANAAAVAASCRWEAGGAVLDFGRAAAADAERLGVASERLVVAPLGVVDAASPGAFLADSFAPVPSGSSAIAPVRLDTLPGSELEFGRRGGLDFHLVAPVDDFVVVVDVAKPSERVTAPAGEPAALESVAGRHLAYSVPCLVERDFAVAVVSIVVAGVLAFAPLGHSEPWQLASVRYPSLNDPSAACGPSCRRGGWLGSLAEQVFHAS